MQQVSRCGQHKSTFSKLVMLTYVFACLFNVPTSESFNWSSLRLVRSHVPYVLSHQPELQRKCRQDPKCPYQSILGDDKTCWGYEEGCDAVSRFGHPDLALACPNNASRDSYWKQADFGYLRERMEEMKSREFCKPRRNHHASLRCTKNAAMCQARNLYIDLRPAYERMHDHNKIAPHSGEIGGYCRLDASALEAETAMKRDLSTWGEPLSAYTSLKFDPWSNTSKYCDVIIDKPVLFVQLDFGGNMYHHFCDFFNLYLTQLYNHSNFNTDVQIIRWDMSPRYGDLFNEAWKAFTDHDHTSLRPYAGKRVCISDATFAFLPRMIFGLFYNTPMPEYCRGTGLFKAFSEHFLHRMGVTDEHNRPVVPPSRSQVPRSIRVTLLDRGAREKYKVYRRVLNQDQLVAAIKKIPDLEVQVVEYNSQKMSFTDQLRITRNTDIFIGMHGAGLTHFLFLPDWAVAFELYNCEDTRCYRDLPRLRGIRYLTWENTSKLQSHNRDEHQNYGKHAKFWNFTFDVEEFVRLVRKARSWVLEHERFKHMRRDRVEL